MNSLRSPLGVVHLIISTKTISAIFDAIRRLTLWGKNRIKPKISSQAIV